MLFLRSCCWTPRGWVRRTRVTGHVGPALILVFGSRGLYVWNDLLAVVVVFWVPPVRDPTPSLAPVLAFPEYHVPSLRDIMPGSSAIRRYQVTSYTRGIIPSLVIEMPIVKHGSLGIRKLEHISSLASKRDVRGIHGTWAVDAATPSPDVAAIRSAEVPNLPETTSNVN